jgi:hypothetical protein
MTVEDYLRSLVPGYDFKSIVLQRAARSPVEVGLERLSLESDIDEDTTEDFAVRLDYASSTIYYSMLGVFSGGSKSEKRADTQISVSGYTVTQTDRERFKTLADNLRTKHGFDIESDGTEDSGMFDATGLYGRNTF